MSEIVEAVKSEAGFHQRQAEAQGSNDNIPDAYYRHRYLKLILDEAVTKLERLADVEAENKRLRQENEEFRRMRAFTESGAQGNESDFEKWLPDDFKGLSPRDPDLDTSKRKHIGILFILSDGKPRNGSMMASEIQRHYGIEVDSDEMGRKMYHLANRRRILEKRGNGFYALRLAAPGP